MWLHSLKVAQLLRSAACLHTNQSRSYLNHLVHTKYTIHSSLWKLCGSYQVTSLSYVIIAINLPNILNHVVSFPVKRVLHSQILILPVLGVGCAMVTVSLIVCIYYNVIMSYTVYYMVSSFASEVPWSKCDPSWADMTTCYVRGSRAVSNTQLMLDLSTEFIKCLQHHVASVCLTYCLSIMYDFQVLQRTPSPYCCRISYVTGTLAPSASSYLIWSP